MSGQKQKLTYKFYTTEITFSSEWKTESGKWIPLGFKSGRPHRCRGRPFNKETRRAWWRRQCHEAEQGREKNREKNTYWTTSPSQYDIEAAKILGVPVTATNDQIREAWRVKCLEYHPDRNPGRWE